MNKDRYFCTLINRLRTNHYNLNESLERKGYTDIADCTCGAEKEDIDYLIWDCTRYTAEREHMSALLRKNRLGHRESIEKILQREDWKKMQVIYQFIKKTNRII